MHQQDQHYREHYGQGEEQGDRVADVDSRPLFVVGAHRLTNADGGAHGQAYDHDGEHMHDLRADGDSSSAGCPLELTDDEQVRHAIQSLQEIGQQIGQREKDDIFEYTSCCEVPFRGTSPLTDCAYYKRCNSCKVKGRSKKVSLRPSNPLSSAYIPTAGKNRPQRTKWLPLKGTIEARARIGLIHD